MKFELNTMKQQTQDFFLRLFVGSSEVGSTPSSSFYTCSRCGTFVRLHH